MIELHGLQVSKSMKYNIKKLICIFIQKIILRLGLSKIILKDYESVLFSRKKVKFEKQAKFKRAKVCTPELKCSFEGLLLERLIKTFYISKKEISPKEFENAITQFLSSYFKFGTIYYYEDFKDILIQCLTDDILSGLTEATKKLFSRESLKTSISNVMTKFREINTVDKLDGLAWKKDLTSVLKNYIIDFIKNLLKSEKFNTQTNFELINKNQPF